MLLLFTGWSTLTTLLVLLCLLISYHLTTCSFCLVYDKYINRVDWKCNTILFNSRWILFSCGVVQLYFSGKSLFAVVVGGSETENAGQSKQSASQQGEKSSAGESGLKLRSRCKGVLGCEQLQGANQPVCYCPALTELSLSLCTLCLSLLNVIARGRDSAFLNSIFMLLVLAGSSHTL